MSFFPVKGPSAPRTLSSDRGVELLAREHGCAADPVGPVVAHRDHKLPGCGGLRAQSREA